MPFSKEKLVDDYRARTPSSERAFIAAQSYLPGGLTRNAVMRRPYPLFIREARGKEAVDLDGNRYVDFVMNLGPNLLGHSHPVIIDAVVEQAKKGTGYGSPSEMEEEVAEWVTRTCPTAERVRFALSGTEATMFMIRLARAFTGRPKIVKFIGFYHGSTDSVMVSNRPTELPYEGEGFTSLPSTDGLMRGTTTEVLAVHYNDLRALEECLDLYRGEVAGIIVDPGGNNCGLVQPKDGFLSGVEKLARENDVLLLFDEVVTGYRYGPGGAQAHFGVRPDLTAFGKAIGGGLPLAAIAGRRDIMELMDITPGSHCGVPQSGTFAGNPLSLAAGKAFFGYLHNTPSMYGHLNRLGSYVREQVSGLSRKYGVPLIASGSHSMFQIHFGIQALRDYRDFARRDAAFREQLYLFMALNGIFIPTPTGSFFLCTEHTDEDVNRFLALLEEFLVQHVAE